MLLGEIMASLTQNNLKRALLAGEIDLVADDIRGALLMLNTTADAEDEEVFMNGFTTLDECDATGYARVALTTQRPVLVRQFPLNARCGRECCIATANASAATKPTDLAT